MATEKLKTCSQSGCEIAMFCSKECQKANWKSHKPQCRALHAETEKKQQKKKNKKKKKA